MMRYGHLLRRLILFVIVLWAAATFNFAIPRMAPNRDPIMERLMQMTAQGGYQQQGIEEMVKAYRIKFGLDKPVFVQYINYLGDMARFDFGVSMALYPTMVADLIMNAIPWTIGLLTVATLLAFVVGTLFGSIVAWPRSPRLVKIMLSPLMAMSAIPYYLFGLVLVYFFSVGLKLFPISGGYSTGTAPALTLSFALNVLHHSVLPAMSIVISAIGFWALGMRGMMVTVQGEGYMFLAEANGLKPSNIFFRYALRNAILPQFTALALSLGFIVSGSILVEVIFTYPGIGSVLYRAISTADYFTIYGVVFIIILSIGLATLIIDLVYPLLDPRITTRRS